MRRVLPRSLLGQMLLAVALALLLAQAISATLIYRGDQQRREARIVNTLAFQLVANEREPRAGEGPRRAQRAQRRQQRIAQVFETGDGHREAEREAALVAVLEAQSIPVAQLVVLRRPIPQGEPAMDGIIGQRAVERARLEGAREFLLAGLKQDAADGWKVARVPIPPPNRGALLAIIAQTLVLYLALVGGMAFMLQRIVRPLAELAERTDKFAGSLGDVVPLEPSGPQDMRRLIAAHNAMEHRIAALIDEKDVMLGAIGHDLKTPLAALRVRIESVENDTERSRMAASIEDITETLDDILSLARVGRPSDPLERTDLGALVASVVEEYEDMARDVELQHSERIAMPLRATWLRRALRNLIGNALRYGEHARVVLRRDGAHAVIVIEDKGPGIPENRIAAMLEPFTRGEASRNRETGGAGLGLTLARAIAEQHGGRLRLCNRIGDDGKVAGLQAELRLPLVT